MKQEHEIESFLKKRSSKEVKRIKKGIKKEGE